MAKLTTEQTLQGVHNWTNGKIVYDISVAHPDGQGNPTPYTDLAAALGTGGANIPEGLRKGGMSVKFIQSSDNKYVQYRLMSDTFNTTLTNWQGVDDKPTAGSDNLVKSGGVQNYILGSIQPFIKKSLDDSDNDLSISDEEGYVIAEFKDGHIRTKNFSSEEKDITLDSEASDANLSISDIRGNIILQLKDGHIKTKEFDSRRVPSNDNPLKDIIWTHFGDSISTNGAYVEEGEHFYDIIAQRNGMTFSASTNVVAGVGRTICYPPEGQEHNYGKIVDYLDRCLPNSTLITILAANNDFAHLVPLGQMEFNGNSIVIPTQTSECTTIVKGLCYMFNYFQTHFPSAKVVFMLPLLSSRSNMGISHAAAAGYTYQDLWDKIIEVSRFFSVEVIKLGPEVGMNPYNAEQNSLYYRDNLHPTALGQLRMANYLEQRLKIIVNN